MEREKRKLARQRNSDSIEDSKRPSMTILLKSGISEHSSSHATPTIILNNIETGGMIRESFPGEKERG